MNAASRPRAADTKAIRFSPHVARERCPRQALSFYAPLKCRPQVVTSRTLQVRPRCLGVTQAFMTDAAGYCSPSCSYDICWVSLKILFSYKPFLTIICSKVNQERLNLNSIALYLTILSSLASFYLIKFQHLICLLLIEIIN